MSTSNTASNTRSGRCFVSPELTHHTALLAHGSAPLEATDAPAWIGATPLWADLTPMGVWADPVTCPLCAGNTSRLAQLLATAPLDDTALLNRARAGMEWWRLSQMCKYSAYSLEKTEVNAPYVLVLDQPRSDESFSEGADSDALMREMLVFSQIELVRPNVVILTCEDGHFTAADASDSITIVPHTANPWRLFESATRVYTQSAALGFEAILSGHQPRVFGTPWYAGWGLTQDENPDPHRTRKLTRAQLFAAAMILYPTWINPRDGTPCRFEEAMARAEALHRAARDDARGYVASGLARWKHTHMRAAFGRTQFEITDNPDTIATARATGLRHMAWGCDAAADLRVEDGFLRSRGLGAALVPPVSLTLDDLGVYFDPTRPSRLETWITARAELPDHAATRIAAFLARLCDARLTKYNTGEALLDLPEGEKILVVGQVEDDASIQCGAGDIATNRALLEAARAAHPDAFLVFKPHPDVEAGLRQGDLKTLDTLADVTARNADPLALIDACDRVWTMTSLMGFEALLRGTPVTCTGTPFYAGWGLTDDRGPVPARRAARPTLDGLAHAALIDFPRYFDPMTGTPISPEDALDILAAQPKGRSALAQTALALLVKLRDRVLG